MAVEGCGGVAGGPTAALREFAERGALPHREARGGMTTANGLIIRTYRTHP